jgi:hypothetical protein
MHPSTLSLIAAVVLGGAASVAGGYFAGGAIGGKTLGPDLAHYLGMLYGPVAGATGVIAGTVVVAILAAQA